MGATASKDDAVAALNAEIEFLEHELDAWIGGLLEDGWNRGVRRVQAEGEKGLTSFVQERLSGLGATTSLVAHGMTTLNALHTDEAQPWDWGTSSLHLLGRRMREQLFPIVYAANKMDIAPEGVLDALRTEPYSHAWPTWNWPCGVPHRPDLSTIRAVNPPSLSAMMPHSTQPRKRRLTTWVSAFVVWVERGWRTSWTTSCLTGCITLWSIPCKMKRTGWTVMVVCFPMPLSFLLAFMPRPWQVALIPTLKQGSFEALTGEPGALSGLTTNWRTVMSSRFTPNLRRESVAFGTVVGR